MYEALAEVLLFTDYRQGPSSTALGAPDHRRDALVDAGVRLRCTGSTAHRPDRLLRQRQQEQWHHPYSAIAALAAFALDTVFGAVQADSPVHRFDMAAVLLPVGSAAGSKAVVAGSKVAAVAAEIES